MSKAAEQGLRSRPRGFGVGLIGDRRLMYFCRRRRDRGREQVHQSRKGAAEARADRPAPADRLYKENQFEQRAKDGFTRIRPPTTSK